MVHIRVLNHTRGALAFRHRVEGRQVIIEVLEPEVRTEGGILIQPDRPQPIPLSRVDN